MVNKNTGKICCFAMEEALREGVLDENDMRLWIGDTEEPFPHEVKFCPWCGAKQER